jgi:hypothetical protein
MIDTYYFDKYSDDDFPIKKQQRNERIDRRAKMRQDFMRVNNIGAKKVILPLLEKRARESKKDKKNE